MAWSRWTGIKSRRSKQMFRPSTFRGSASRARTYNPAVTVYPTFSRRPGLSHHPTVAGSRALLRLIGENPHPLVSARFPLRSFSSRNFAQDYHLLQKQKLGFPEFTRLFNPDYSERLQYPREFLDDNLRISLRICLTPLAP